MLFPEDEVIKEQHCGPVGTENEGDPNTWMSLEDRQEGKRPDSKDPAHLLATLGASRQDRGDCHAGSREGG